MTTYLKVMSDEHHLPDSNNRKNYTFIAVPDGYRIHFQKDLSYPEDDPHIIALVGPWAGLEGISEPWPKQMESYVVAIPGNAYVMNDKGDTIARKSSFDANGLPYKSSRPDGDVIEVPTLIHITLDKDDPAPTETVRLVTELLKPLKRVRLVTVLSNH